MEVNQINNENYNNRIVREPERFHITGVKRGTWKNLEKSGNAPTGIKLSENTKGWRYSDLMAWIEDKFSEATI